MKGERGEYGEGGGWVKGTREMERGRSSGCVMRLGYHDPS